MIRPMARWRLIALILLLVAAAPAPEPVMPDGRPADFYSCHVVRLVDGGQITVTARLELDGREKDYLAIWSASDATRSFGQSMNWWGGNWQALTASEPRVYLAFHLPQAHWARLEVRPAEGGRALFVSQVRSSDVQNLWLPWQRFAPVQAAAGLTALVTGRGGAVVAQAPIAAFSRDAGLAVIRTTREPLAAMAADYPNRCEPGSDSEIIAT
jgi:hypothetical protein